MKDFSLKPLSEGLGFYEDELIFQSVHKRGDKKKPPPEFSDHLSDDILPKKLDLDNFQTYEHLLSLLEKPWLGKENTLNSESKKQVLCTRTLPASNSSPTVSSSVFQGETLSPSDDQKLVSVRKNDSDQESVKKHGWSFGFLKKNKLPVKEKDIDTTEAFQPDEKKEQKEKTSLNFPVAFEKTFYFSLKSYITDAFVVSLLFFPSLISFVFLTQSEPETVLWSIWPKILIAFLFFSQIYCLACRLFCFETFGEALAKVRLSTLGAQTEVHPFLLFWRFLLSCLTGVVCLPLLSLVFRKDFLARLTGLYFQKTKIVK